MKLFCKISLLLTTTILISCTFNNKEIFIIDEINVFKNPEENESLGKDLISYDYVNLIIAEFKIENYELLRGVTYQYFVQEDNQMVTFRLILSNNARELKDKLVPFFENFISEKQREHKKKDLKIREAVVKSNEVIKLIEKESYDSLWGLASPTLINMIEQEDFLGMVEERKSKFLPEGDRIVQSRQVYSEMGNGIKGEYYVVNYEFKNMVFEQVILELIDNKLRLLGYKYFVPNN